jgi:hypothetical protein
MANGNHRPASPQPAFGQSSIKALLGDSRPPPFTPKHATIAEALQAALARQQPAQSRVHDDEPDDAVAETPREARLEDRLREVIGDEVYVELTKDAMTEMALTNWLHSTGVKHLACARTLSHMIASSLDSMDLLDRITREVEAIG